MDFLSWFCQERDSRHESRIEHNYKGSHFKYSQNSPGFIFTQFLWVATIFSDSFCFSAYYAWVATTLIIMKASSSAKVIFLCNWTRILTNWKSHWNLANKCLQKSEDLRLSISPLTKVLLIKKIYCYSNKLNDSELPTCSTSFRSQIAFVWNFSSG